MGNTLKYKGYIGSIEVSDEDDCLYGSIQHINDLITYEGQTVPDLKKAFQEQVEDYLLLCKEVGKKPDKPYSGSFNVRIGPDLHRKLAIYAQKKDCSLNKVIKKAIINYVQQPVVPATKNYYVNLNMSEHKKIIKEKSRLKDYSEWSQYGGFGSLRLVRS